MAAELAKLGHPMLAALLTVGLSAPIQAETPPEAPQAAQEAPLAEELELMTEEETVSIASRYEQPISEAPANVYVITDEDIRQSGTIDIPTLLRRIPGMEVMQTTGAMFNVAVRGDNQVNANKLLVMVDGRSIYIDMQGTVQWKLLPVTLPEIKRIEVLKGPASAVWGFNAFDGIINIITKSPEEIKGTTLQFGGGNFGTITGSAIHAGTAGKLGYRLSLGTNQNASWTNSSSLAFRDNLFNVQTEYALPADAKFTLSGGLVDSNRFDGQFAPDLINPIKPAQGYVYSGYERPNFFVRAFWNYYSDTTGTTFNPLLAPFFQPVYRSGTSTNYFAANTYNIDAQHILELWPGNRLTYGANYRYNTLSSTLVANFTTENRLGLFVQDEWRATKVFTLMAGARYDMDTFINPTISPRVALMYSPATDHTFRISASVAYRPPTMIETNAIGQTTTPFSPVPITTQGNPNLNPERIISYEADYQGWYFKHRLQARTAVFFNHISDLITFANVSPTLVTSVNAPGVADIYGVEVGANVLLTKWLTGFANYSYQHIGQTFTGEIKRAGPANKYNVGLRGDWENGLSAEAIFHYYGGVTYPLPGSFTSLAPFFPPGSMVPNPNVGGYNLLNLRSGYRFWKQKASAGYMREAEVAISVFNALDDRSREFPTGEEIGRRIMGWLTVRF